MITFDADFTIFTSSLINDSCFFSGFSTKSAGDGRKTSNILQFLDKHNVRYKKLVILRQIHSVNIYIYHKTNEQLVETIDDVDGVITEQKETVLAVRTADCLPLIFADKTAGLVGVSHQGWRGSLKKMAVRMVDVLVERGAQKENLIVAMGPAVGACCYDIGPDRYAEFMEQFEVYADQIFHIEGGRYHLNLSRLNYLQLRDCGVQSSHIDFFPFCTACDKNRFFSFRRDKKEKLGEMFSFIKFNLGRVNN